MRLIDTAERHYGTTHNRTATMEIFNASNADSLFSATLTQSNGLESLANAALQRGIDA